MRFVRRHIVTTDELERLRRLETEFHAIRSRVRLLALRYHGAAAGNELNETARRTIGACGCDLDGVIADVGSSTWRKGLTRLERRGRA